MIIASMCLSVIFQLLQCINGEKLTMHELQMQEGPEVSNQ